jgi:hypothetical protein
LKFELAIDRKLKLDTGNFGKYKKAQAQLIVKYRLIQNSLVARLEKSLLANVCEKYMSRETANDNKEHLL